MSEQRPDRPNGKRSRPGLTNGGMKFGRGLMGWLLFVALAALLFVWLKQSNSGTTTIPLSAMWQQVETTPPNIEKIVIDGDEVTGVFKNAVMVETRSVKNFRTALPGATASNWQFTSDLLKALKNTASVQAEPTNNILVNILLPLVPWLLILGFIWFFVFRQLRNSAGAGGMLGSFGRSRAKLTSKENTNITFDDVAGVEEAKEEVMEIVEFLKNPKKFQRLGGRIPCGVLLVGEPGTGKTLLAKAIAGEADVPFFSISGSDFVEMFVGVGASRVRDLFKQAKDNSPCIIFLDEIDAVGRRRGSGFSSGGHDEREQTLNAILVEMDGF